MKAKIQPDGSIALATPSELRVITPSHKDHGRLCVLIHGRMHRIDLSAASDPDYGFRLPEGYGGHPWRGGSPDYTQVYAIPTEEIHVDPDRLQFRDGVDENGVGNESDDEWNDDLAGTLHVWKDPFNGHTYIVDGHHRLAKAKAHGVPSVKAKYIEATTDEEAKAEGKRINEEGGTAGDVDTETGINDETSEQHYVDGEPHSDVALFLDRFAVLEKKVDAMSELIGLRNGIHASKVSLSSGDDLDDIDTEDLANFYAELWEGLTPQAVGDAELSTVHDELSRGKFSLTWSKNDGWKVVEVGDGDGGTVRLSVHHAPRGGVTIDGKAFRGGQFIPSKDYAKATPEEKKKIDEPAKAASDARKARGSVDTEKVRSKIKEKHGHHELTSQEKTSAKRSLNALIAHHGELTVHRLEEIADSLHAAYDKTPEDEEGQRAQFSRRLKAVEHMLDMAKEKGLYGDMRQHDRADFEKHLKDSGLAFVGIDPGSKMTDGSPIPDSLDALILTKDGRKLLATTQKASPASDDELRELQKVFGDKYEVARFAKVDGEWKEIAKENGHEGKVEKAAKANVKPNDEANDSRRQRNAEEVERASNPPGESTTPDHQDPPDPAIASTGTQADVPDVSPDIDPREIADQAKKSLDADYEFARSSDIPNLGEDLKGSARHKVNAWKSLAQAESDGTAEEMVTRANLLKNEPHNLMANVTPANALSSLAAHFAINAFPSAPYDADSLKSYQKVGDVPPDQLRKQYYDAYQAVKSEAEKLAQSEPDPRKVADSLRSVVGKIIGDIRNVMVKDKYGTPVSDRFNPVANALCDLSRRLGTFRPKSTYVMARVEDFAGRLKKAYGETPTEDMLGKAAEHVKDVMEGESFNKTFGTVEGGRKGFDPAEVYVKHATRKGGREVNASTVKAGSDFVMNNLKMRGLQWGNSVTDDEREYHLQKSSEALADLADVVGFPDDAMSLHGVLGLAIGARGKGTASAHYEPGTKVINLTRKNGVGTLAHEWGHALDHYLTGGSVSNSGGDYMSNRTSQFRFKKNPDGSWATTDGRSMATDDFSDDPIWSGMDSVRKAMKDTGFDKRLASNLRLAVQQGVISESKANDYWNSNHEKFARTFERYVQHKLRQSDRDNTYLAGLSDNDKWGFWPNDEEIAKIAPAMDLLLSAVKVKHFQDDGDGPEVLAEPESKPKELEPAKPKPAASGFGTEGDGHPLAGMTPEQKRKKVSELNLKANDGGVADVEGVAKAGPPKGLDMKAFGEDLAAAVSAHEEKHGVGDAFTTFYESVGKKHGLSKFDFLRAVNKEYEDGRIRLGGWPGVLREIPDPDLFYHVSGKGMYYIHGVTKGPPVSTRRVPLSSAIDLAGGYDASATVKAEAVRLLREMFPLSDYNA